MAGVGARELADTLAGSGVRGVALTWVDNAGITRVKAVPVDRLEAATSSGVGMSPVFDVYGSDDSMTIGAFTGGPVGDLRLFPDLDRVTQLQPIPRWARGRPSTVGPKRASRTAAASGHSPAPCRPRRRRPRWR